MNEQQTRRLPRVIGAFQGDGRGWTLLSVAAGWFLTVGSLLTVPALLPFIRAAFSVSNTTAGIAVSIMWLVYALFQFPAGLLTDRVGERAVLLPGLVVLGLGVVAFSLAPTFVVLLVTVGAIGIGAGLFATPRVTLLSRTFPDNDGAALGIVMATGNVGAAVLPAAAGVAAAAIGFQHGVLFAAPLFAVAVVAAVRSIPHADPNAADPTSPLRLARTLAEAIASRRTALATIAVTLTFFSFQGISAFLTTYLTVVEGLSPGSAAALFGLLFAVAAVVQPLAGGLADRVGDRPVLISITAIYALLLASVPFVGPPVVPFVVVLLGVQRGATPVAMAYLSAVLPPDVRGSGFGLLRMIFTGIASTGAIFVGIFADTHRFRLAFLLLAVLVTVATGCYALLPPRE